MTVVDQTATGAMRSAAFAGELVETSIEDRADRLALIGGGKAAMRSPAALVAGGLEAQPMLGGAAGIVAVVGFVEVLHIVRV